MTINLHLPTHSDTLRPKITVIGVGGAGGNAVNNMIASNLEGVDFVIANTDAQALEGALTERIIQLGAGVTRGLGAGAKPEVGLAAAEEAIEEISASMQGSNMVFITAGMGGGTGTGAAPVIARIAKEQGMLTVGVVTKPFQFEGQHRMRLAEAGIRELQQYVDTLIVVPNQNLFRIANEKTTFAESFRLADEVLHSGVRGVTDLIVKPGLINLDFADIRTVMGEMGKAMMGAGEASGDQRAMMAAEAAISNPLLDDVSLKGAKAVLINITAGPDFALYEVDEAVNRIRDEVDPDANIIVGSAFSDSMEGKVRVSVVATGIEAHEMQQHRPSSGELVSATSQAARKPFGAAAPVVRREAPVVPPLAPSPAARERTAAEIVRQSGTASVHEVARQAATARATAAPVAPPIRIIDEAAREQEERALWAQQQAAAAAAAQAVQVEQTMRAATPAAPPRTVAPAPAESAAGPLFISPRAEQPPQRTLFASAAPAFAEEEEEEIAGRNIFGRLANVGKAIAAGRTEPKRAEAAPAPRKAEVRETTPSASEEEEFYDIPAFLRRQAN